MPVKNPAQTEGLEIVDADSPGFSQEIRRLLTPDAQRTASPFLPYSFVILNNTGRYIWGFTVVYTFPDWISGSGAPWRFEFSHTARGSDRRYMLAPGDRFLMTPISSFVASCDANGKRSKQPLLDEGLDRIIRVYLPRLNQHTEAAIDSVIFEDGLLVGPDSIGRLQSVIDRSRANSDLASAIRDLRGDELRKELVVLSTASGSNDPYTDQKGDVASALLRMLDQQGESTVLQVLQRIGSPKSYGSFDKVWRKAE